MQPMGPYPPCPPMPAKHRSQIMLEPAKEQLKEARGLVDDFGLKGRIWYEFSDKELARLIAYIRREATNSALERAANMLERVNNHDNPMTASDCADEIRTMKEPT